MLLVTGGTGTTGRELVRLLRERHAAFRVLTRNAAGARALLGADVALAQGDPAVPATLATALDGVDTVFLLSPNTPDQVRLERNLLYAAREAGVQRIVKHSGYLPQEDPTGSVGHWHYLVEQEIRSCGLDFTFLRPGFYMQNFLMYIPDLRAGRLRIPVTASALVSCVDARDVAAAEAAVLTGAGHEHGVYHLTGALVSAAGIARAFGDAVGTTVRYEQIPEDEARRELTDTVGMPDWLATYVLSLYRGFNQGRHMTDTEAVEILTGTRPRTFDQFAADYAPALGLGLEAP